MSDKDLYEHWRRSGRDEPAAELDARILAAAHEAVGETKRQRRRPSWIARFAPLSVAAVAVLGVALSMRVAEEEPGLRPSPPPPAASSPAPPGPSSAAPVATASEQAAREAAVKAESRADRVLRDDAAVEAKRKGEFVGKRSDRSFEGDQPARRRQDAAELATPQWAPAAALRAEEGVTTAGEPADATRWLADIERLLAAGETEQARQSLQRFRLAHPDFPLPASLADLAGN